MIFVRSVRQGWYGSGAVRLAQKGSSGGLEVKTNCKGQVCVISRVFICEGDRGSGGRQYIQSVLGYTISATVGTAYYSLRYGGCR